MKSKKKQEREKKQAEILNTLPGFVNQLLLLHGSGMVLTDALLRIAEGYANLPARQQNSFTCGYVRAVKGAVKSGENPLDAFLEFGRYSNVKELSRIANLLLENREKGTDLWEKLEEQSDALWHLRKQNVLRGIRLTESRMSFPLGLYLIALIILTAAPALMQM